MMWEEYRGKISYKDIEVLLSCSFIQAYRAIQEDYYREDGSKEDEYLDELADMTHLNDLFIVLNRPLVSSRVSYCNGKYLELCGIRDFFEEGKEKYYTEEATSETIHTLEFLLKRSPTAIDVEETISNRETLIEIMEDTLTKDEMAEFMLIFPLVII